MAVELLDEKAFNSKIIEGKETAIVDFFAGWCGPCKAFGPIFDSVSDELKGKLSFYKVSVEEETELAGKNNVMTIPTVIFFKAGKETERFIGAFQKDKVITFIEKNIGGN